MKMTLMILWLTAAVALPASCIYEAKYGNVQAIKPLINIAGDTITMKVDENWRTSSVRVRNTNLEVNQQGLLRIPPDRVEDYVQ